MKYYELEYELKLAYKRGYEDKGVRDYDFHQHSYELLDNFERKSCDGCIHFEADMWESNRGTCRNKNTPVKNFMVDCDECYDKLVKAQKYIKDLEEQLRNKQENGWMNK